MPGITTSEKTKSNSRVFTNSSALAPLSQTVASCPASRNARASDAKVLASSSMISKFALGAILTSAGQLDNECAAFAWFALRPHFALMIAHHRLHNRQAQPGAVLFAGV